MGNDNTHVANASCMFIRARVAQKKIVIKDIDASGGITVGTSISLNGSLKTSLDRTLDTTGFARLGPFEALEFDVNLGGGDAYVTITTADDPEPRVIAYNYTVPNGRSVIVTENGTIQLSQNSGDLWTAPDGTTYCPCNARCIQKQTDVNKRGSGCQGESQNGACHAVAVGECKRHNKNKSNKNKSNKNTSKSKKVGCAIC